MHKLEFNDLTYHIIAVYCLWKDNTRFYIGRTNNLKNRLYQHRANVKDEQYHWKEQINKITYFKCNTVTDSDILETFLINKLKPVYNDCKVFGDNPTFVIDVPQENEVITNSRNYGCFRTLAESLYNQEITIKDVESTHSLLAEAYHKLGINRIRALGYNSYKIKNELNTLAAKDNINLEIRKLFEEGNFYSSKDIKVKLSNLYKNLGINKKAKATDIEEVFDIKYIDKKINGKTVRGYQL